MAKDRNICFPDYNNSIMNLSCSIMASFGAKPFHSPLNHSSLLTLEKKDNVVFIVLDGLGVNILKSYAKKNPASFLFNNLKSEISSVFPSTTASAITTFRTAKSPLEHGVVGWSLYFKEFGTAIEILPMFDSFKKISLSSEKYPVFDIIKLKTIAEEILSANKNAKKKVKCYDVMPLEFKESYYNSEASKGFIKSFSKDFKGMARTVASLARKKTSYRKLIVAYSMQPDSTLHKEGLNGKNVDKIISSLEKEIVWLSKKLKGTSSALIITADHGQIDCDNRIIINNQSKIFDSVTLPLFPESRFVSFFVKDDKKKEFVREMKKFKNDFILMDRKEFFDKNILGEGKKHPKVDDFIGDYVAIAFGDKQIKQSFPGIKSNNLKGHHAGITKEEMTVPLIVVDFDNN
jgi:predicted AlkP superfamily pyrophosphatase or phosphodiesterase